MYAFDIAACGESRMIDEEITLKKLEVFLAFMRLNSLARVSEALGQSTVSTLLP